MEQMYPPQYLEGVRLFNAEDFFEAHEVWEELWSETQDEHKKFYQGLIQAAVALLHFGNENLGGAKKVYISCRKYLEPYQPQHQGLDVSAFLANLQFCFEELMENQEACPTGIAIRDERVPKLPEPNAADKIQGETQGATQGET